MKTKTIKLIVVSFALFLIESKTRANDGNLDLSFGVDGRSAVAVGTSSFLTLNTFTSTIESVEGGSFTAGSVWIPNTSSPNNATIIKCDSNGFPDNSFGTDGIVYPDFTIQGTSVIPRIDKMFLEETGKLLCFGSIIDTSNLYRTVLFKYNTDGSVDDSFGTNGIVILDFGHTNEYLVNTFSTGSDNYRLLISDVDTFPSGDLRIDHCFLTEIDGNGSINTSYGTQGLYYLSDTNFIASASTIDENNNIYIGGYSNDPLINSVVKVDATGNNEIIFSVPVALRYGIKGLLVSDLEEIYIVSQERVIPWSLDVVVIGLNQSGNLNLSFGDNGITRINGPENPFSSTINVSDRLYDAKLQSDGKIVIFAISSAIGLTHTLTTYRVLSFFRLNNDGNLDESFGIGGKSVILYPMANLDGLFGTMNIQGDDKILAAFPIANSTSPGLGLVRLDNEISESLKKNGFNSTGNIEENEISVSIFPNPVQEALTINFNSYIEEELTYTIFNITGKVVNTGVLSNTYGGKVQLSTEELIPGNYFLQLSSENNANVFSDKIVKQ